MTFACTSEQERTNWMTNIHLGSLASSSATKTTTDALISLASALPPPFIPTSGSGISQRDDDLVSNASSAGSSASGQTFCLTIATATATAFATNGTNSCCSWPGVPKPPGSIRCGAAWLAQGWFMLLIMAANVIRDDDNDDSGSVYNVNDTAGYRCFGRCRGCKRNIHGSASW